LNPNPNQGPIHHILLHETFKENIHEKIVFEINYETGTYRKLKLTYPHRLQSTNPPSLSSAITTTTMPTSISTLLLNDHNNNNKPKYSELDLQLQTHTHTQTQIQIQTEVQNQFCNQTKSPKSETQKRITSDPPPDFIPLKRIKSTNISDKNSKNDQRETETNTQSQQLKTDNNSNNVVIKELNMMPVWAKHKYSRGIWR
jgi:hypothetical protein